MPKEKKENEVVKESTKEEATAKLKEAIAKLKAEVNNLNILAENCEKLKQSKRLIISEDNPDKEAKDVFKFALTGGIVLDIMTLIDKFISDMRSKTINRQNELLSELDEFL